MTKFSLERGSYRTAGEVAANIFIRVAVTLILTLSLVWLRFVFDFQVAILFALAIITVTLWSIESK